MARKSYQGYCDCGYKTAPARSMEIAQQRLIRHKHKIRIVEWTHQTPGFATGVKVA